MDKEEYKRYVESRAKHSHCMVNAIRAFFCGGGICCLGQILSFLYETIGLERQMAALCVSLTLIFLAGLLTGIGWFDKLAKVAGAGVLIPITGFANAVAAPAIDARTEGYITGVAAKMFSIAGPVIVYGCVSSMVYGLFCYLLRL